MVMLLVVVLLSAVLFYVLMLVLLTMVLMVLLLVEDVGDVAVIDACVVVECDVGVDVVDVINGGGVAGVCVVVVVGCVDAVVL